MRSRTPTLISKSPRPTVCSSSAGGQLIILLSASSLLIALMLSWAQLSQASPSPLSVQSGSPQNQQLEAAEPASSAKLHEHDQQSLAHQQKQLAGTNSNGKLPTRPQNNVGKLKRGMSNFISQMNAAPFFVQADGTGDLGDQPSGGPIKSMADKVGGGGGPQSAAEPTALVNGDPTGDWLIKGPRTIGGPLRWGRR